MMRMNGVLSVLLVVGWLFVPTSYVVAGKPWNDGGYETLCAHEDTTGMMEEVRKTRSGIIIVGEGSKVRAFEPFGGSRDGGVTYASSVNGYKKLFGDRVNVYCMIIPTAAEYYCPESARCWSKDERSAIDGIYNHLSDSVEKVDVCPVLAEHVHEDIYSRTDHHWAPLGAYYAAKAFAEVAGVPFADLSTYDKCVVKDYVGTMWRFSRDKAVKNAPEEFEYHVPRNVDYTTTYIKYRLDKNRRVTGTYAPERGDFFRHYEDGSSGAYLTFMGGDTRTVTVRTSTGNGRRLLIMKDSYGNALPAYLFHSFEEIHVLDFRYFTKSVVAYARDNRITDMLFANNIFHANLESTSRAYMGLM